MRRQALMLYPVYRGGNNRRMITLIPINHVELEPLEKLRQPLEEMFLQPVEMGPELAVTDRSRDTPMAQYRADLILDRLPNSHNGNRCLGVLNLDIYAFGLNFIFGEADGRTKKALISLFRLKPEYYRAAPDAAIFHTRTLVEAVHEIGHTYGLRHCPNSHCAMHFSSTVEDTDVKGYKLCWLCQQYINKRL
jgi:archaemetzincin